MKNINFLEWARIHLVEQGGINNDRIYNAVVFYKQEFTYQIIEKYFIKPEMIIAFCEYNENFTNPKTIDGFMTKLDELEYPVLFNELALKELNFNPEGYKPKSNLT